MRQQRILLVDFRFLLFQAKLLVLQDRLQFRQRRGLLRQRGFLGSQFGFLFIQLFLLQGDLILALLQVALRQTAMIRTNSKSSPDIISEYERQTLLDELSSIFLLCTFFISAGLLYGSDYLKKPRLCAFLACAFALRSSREIIWSILSVSSSISWIS